jgi:hypothetical protein
MAKVDVNWVLIYLGLAAILIELLIGVHTGLIWSFWGFQ